MVFYNKLSGVCAMLLNDSRKQDTRVPGGKSVRRGVGQL